MGLKPVLNIAVLGEAWHGKSTFIGRLLHALGEVSDKALERMEKLASSLGKPGSGYAFLIDKKLEERRTGHTHDISAWRPVDLGPFRAKLINTPGLLRHVRNTIPGVSQADAAIFILDASSADRLMEARGLREHVAFCMAFGIQQAIAVVNKMDLVGYRRGAFEEAVEGFRSLVESLGYELESIFVPASALRGDNMTEPSPAMPWHDGPTVLEAIRGLRVPERKASGPLRLPVHRYYDAARAAAGVIRSGLLETGSEVVVAPSGARGVVESIQSWGEELREAGPGEDVGVRLRGVARYELKKGSVISGPDDVPPVAGELEAEVRVLGPSGLRKGACPTLFCHEASAQVRVEGVAGGRTELEPGSEAMLVLKPLAGGRKGLVIEPSDRLPEMAGLLLRMGVGSGPGAVTVAVGTCVSVEGG